MQDNDTTCILIPAASLVSDSWKYIDLLLRSMEDGDFLGKIEVNIAFDGCSEEFIDKVYDKFPWVRFDKRLINLGRPRNYCGNVNMGLRILHGLENKSVIVINQGTVLPR